MIFGHQSILARKVHQLFNNWSALLLLPGFKEFLIQLCVLSKTLDCLLEFFFYLKAIIKTPDLS